LAAGGDRAEHDAMPPISKFEDLVAWQLCMTLSDAVAALVSNFEDTRLRDQMRAAANSAPALIAEGFRRYTPAEFVRYLRMARGELGELQTDLEIARRRKYCRSEEFDTINTLARRAMGTTTNLLKAKLKQLEDAKAKPTRPR
jgi:four helix bundle protein